jgi:PAS domain S-box-containing protein
MGQPPEDPEIYRNILDSLDLGVCLVDPEGKITFWNSGAERITGYTRGEVLGREDTLVHCSGAGQVPCSEECPQGQAGADGAPGPATLYLRHKKGHRVPVHIKTAVLHDRKGAVVGAAEFFGDQFLAETAADGQSGFASLKCRRRVRASNAEGLPHAEPGGFELVRQPFGVLACQLYEWAALRVSRGKAAAEAAIRVLAETLLYALHPADVFGRWNDGDFLVVTRDRNDRALELDADLLRNLARNAQFLWWGDRVPLTISAGGAMVRADDTEESMRKRAEAALERNIELGGDRAAVADEGSLKCLR